MRMEEKLKKEHSSELTVPTPLFSNFYQDQYKRAVFATAFATLINLICAFLIIFLLLQKPVDIYMSAEEVSPTFPPSLAISNYSITPRISIDKANFSEEELNGWLVTTVIKLFTYDLQDYTAELNRNRFYLLPEAQPGYLNLLNSITPFSQYTTKDTIVSVVHPKGAPALYDQGVTNGRYYWIFDLPIDVQYSGSVNVPSQSVSLHIVIVRTSMDNDVYGIKIASITANSVKKINSPLA